MYMGYRQIFGHIYCHHYVPNTNFSNLLINHQLPIKERKNLKARSLPQIFSGCRENSVYKLYLARKSVFLLVLQSREIGEIK